MELTFDKLREMADFLPGNTIIYQIDNKGYRAIYYTKSVPSLYGYTQEEFAERDKYSGCELVYTQDREIISRKLEECVAGEGETDIVFRIVTKAGDVKWVHAYSHVVGELDGKAVICATLYDARHGILNSDVVLDTSDRAVVVISKQTHSVLYGNKLFFDMAETSYEKAVGKPCYEAICKMHGYDEKNCFCRKSIDCDEPLISYDPVKDKYFSLTGREILWGEHEAIVYYMSDVTEERKKDIELEEKNKQIYKMLSQSIAAYKNHLDTVMKFNPDALSTCRINLTKNTCTNMTSEYENMMCLADEGTVDGYFEKAKEFIVSSREDISGLIPDNQKLLEDFENGRTVLSLDCICTVDEGDDRLLRTNIRLVRNPTTNDIEGIIYTTDISQRELYAKIMQQLFEKEYEGIATIDMLRSTYSLVQFSYDNGIVSTSKNMDYEDGVRRLVIKYVCNDERDVYLKNASIDTIKAQLEKGETYAFTANFINDKGEKRLKKITYFYLDEHRDFVLSTTEDITTITSKEQQRLEELNGALLAAERATEQRTTFFANLSHDMRTPLNGVLGFTRLAMKSDDVTEKDRCLDKIKSSGDFLLHLINDTLDLSKMESNSMTFYPQVYEASEIIGSVVNSVEETARLNGVELKVNLSNAHLQNIRVDRLRLQQVFVNLLSNAIKFTHKGGTVELIIECLDEEVRGTNCKLTVKDNGIGMSKEFLPRAFEAFTQQENVQSQNAAGTGLGLAIVRQIVSLMNGFIELESEEGKGTRFDVYLPLEQTSDKVLKKSESNDFTVLEGRNILLCEDHIINLELATKLLKSKGMNVVSAGNGQIGVDTFSNSKEGYFDAVLMDIRMPVMDGIEAAKAIRGLSRADAKTVPIIAMTANAFESDREATARAGMNAHLTKPIEPEALYRTISAMVTNSEIL